MGLRPSQARVKNALRKMAYENPGVTYIAMYASNGEVAIVPETATDYTDSGELIVRSQYRDMVNYAMSVLRRKYVSKQEHEFKLAESRLLTSVVVKTRDGITVAQLTVPEAGLIMERRLS